MSVNIELPSAGSLALLAPDKKKENIFAPMGQIRDGISLASRGAEAVPHAPRFAPAGQSTQMIVGATPESDRQILTLTQGLYDKYHLKRVFYSAYMPVSNSPLLPAPQNFSRPFSGSTGCTRRTGCCGSTTSGRRSFWTRRPPTWTPDWTPSAPGPCATWSSSRWRSTGRTMRPSSGCRGVGVRSARRILTARRVGPLTFEGLKRLGGGLKAGPVFPHLLRETLNGLRVREDGLLRHLAALDAPRSR